MSATTPQNDPHKPRSVSPFKVLVNVLIGCLVHRVFAPPLSAKSNPSTMRWPPCDLRPVSFLSENATFAAEREPLRHRGPQFRTRPRGRDLRRQVSQRRVHSPGAADRGQVRRPRARSAASLWRANAACRLSVFPRIGGVRASRFFSASASWSATCCDGRCGPSLFDPRRRPLPARLASTARPSLGPGSAIP